MITYPYLPSLISGYCASPATGEPVLNPAYDPLLARSSDLFKKERREADRLRKTFKRRSPAMQGDFLQQAEFRSYFDFISSRLGLSGRPDLKLRMLQREIEEFLRYEQIDFEEFVKWFGASCFLLGFKASQRSKPNWNGAVFAAALHELNQPSQMCVVLERGHISAIDIERIALEGLPAGTAVEGQFGRGGEFDKERLFRMAGLTGLIWQLAYFYAFFVNDTADCIEFSPAPVPTDGPIWSGSRAWIDALGAFAERFHAEPGGTRGPKSRTIPIAAMLAKKDTGLDHMIRKLRALRKGSQALTYSDVARISSQIEFATGAERTTDGWQTEHLRIGLQGHIAGFMGYLERVWSHAAELWDQPDLIEDLHEVWQDWPLILKHAIGCQRRIMEDHGQ